ncbi:MAG: hypothetical protein ABIA63_08740, partial [bacterium]
TQKAVNEVRRVLKTGAQAFIMLYNKISLNYLAHLISRTSFDAGLKGEKCPLEKAYTRKGIKRLFSEYSDVLINVEYLFGTGWGLINRLVPIRVHRFFGKSFGWHTMIRAVKK